jgi:mannitol/fructose-specific phosphotransferase system IIA component (Ntr-type)
MRAESAADVIARLGTRLQAGGFVKDSWTQATIEEEPVEFGEMGSPDSTVPVRIVCALAVAHSELLVTLLQRLVEMFQSPGVLGQIAGAQSPAEIVEIFDRHIQVK